MHASATAGSPRTRRLQRSCLAVPATSEVFFEKAAKGEADEVFLDLEDAVSPGEKERARHLAIAAINDIDWQDKIVAVRVNGLDTPWGYRDIVDVVEQCPRLDLIMLPKAGSAADVQFVDTLLSGIELAIGRRDPIGIEALIESAMGMVNAAKIAQASPRLEALIFGVGDYMIDMQTSDMRMGSLNQDYAVVNDIDGAQAASSYLANHWHYAQSRIATVCRAYGLRPIDGPYTDFSDMAGYQASACRGRALGFEGKWAIHPSQVAQANTAFTPSAQRVSWAARVAQAMDDAVGQGRGAINLDGELIDMAHVKLAANIRRRAALAAGNPNESA
ncbi:HpcH/HpaI aldolase/citrate lyase family protein [Pollutimonas bauzanensis]|uniref:Beta-methylmalyl-CoA/L-malyl-CoA lyase n=1 Tax=Pollutimonas bauzanensis TaxID=658167 RepID=A0A1M5PVX2_9BURK|nr:CoA ester lyase [Pollutimonas bauzanensis]SHH05661.1 beta-methylmalyl-CoA/L-malyl-CoA lyase [Pollutimonas bauzanensis]